MLCWLNCYILSPFRVREINHYQLFIRAEPESGFFLFCYQSSATRNRTAWSGVLLLSPEEFRTRIANDEFLEYEEVYKDRYYGTLKSQVEAQLACRTKCGF